MMQEIENELSKWGAEIEQFCLPRWEQMPELDLYMDQVLTLIEDYLSPLISEENGKLLTASMVNNYVKLGLIPPPNKKRYDRQHLAFLVAITLLKQVLTIPEIKEGILFQGKINGTKEAYNLFCEEQEYALRMIGLQAQGKPHDSFFPQPVEVSYIAVKAATLSFSTKLISEKAIELEMKYMNERKK